MIRKTAMGIRVSMADKYDEDGFEECIDCDEAIDLHREGIAHCVRCGWEKADCEGHIAEIVGEKLSGG